LEIPALDVAGTAVDVARAYAQRLKLQLKATDAERAALSAALASALLLKTIETLQNTAKEIDLVLKELDPGASAWVRFGEPPSEDSHFWRAQVVRAAKQVDFFANLDDGYWWACMNVRVLHNFLRYVVVIQKVGRGETGVLAVTVFAESVIDTKEFETERTLPTPLIELAPSDSVNLFHSDKPDDRWEDVHALIERTSAAATGSFLQLLG
jgi:hypothetical protein